MVGDELAIAASPFCEQPSPYGSFNNKRPRDTDDIDGPLHKRTRQNLCIAEPDNSPYARRWACPFQKYDPVGERSCGTPKQINRSGGFSDLSRLKTHLKDSHDSSQRCKKCWVQIKARPGVEQLVCLQQHEEASTCAPRPSPRKYWLGDEERQALSVTQYGDDNERWYHLMKLVVPDLWAHSLEEIKSKHTPWYEPSSGALRAGSTPPVSPLTPRTTPHDPPSRVSTTNPCSEISAPSVNILDQASHLFPGVDISGMEWNWSHDTLGAPHMSDSIYFSQDTNNRNPLQPIDHNERRLKPSPIPLSTPAIAKDGAFDDPPLSDGRLQPDVRKLRERNLQFQDLLTSIKRSLLGLNDQLHEIKRLDVAKTDVGLASILSKAMRSSDSMLFKLDDI